MNRFIDRLKIAFVVIFAVLTAAAWSYQLFWRIPQQKCEARGAWWDWRDRTCAIPIPLSTLTGRFPARPDLGSVADVQKDLKAEEAKAAPAKPK